MPGNHRSGGQNRKSDELHKIHGTFRSDRHGELATEAPEDLGEHSIFEFAALDSDSEVKQLYDLLLPYLEPALRPTDSAALAMLCSTWSLYLAALKEAKANPTDKDIRGAVMAYFAACDKLFGRFGLTPADRARLKLPTPSAAKSSDPFDDFLNQDPDRVDRRRRGGETMNEGWILSELQQIDDAIDDARSADDRESLAMHLSEANDHLENLRNFFINPKHGESK